MSHLFAFRGHIVCATFMRRSNNRNLLDNSQINTRINKRIRFLGIVRQQTHTTETEIFQDLQSDHVVAHIRFEAQTMVGFNSIQPFILQLISLEFRQQPDSTSFLRKIDNSTGSFVVNHSHRHSNACERAAIRPC